MLRVGVVGPQSTVERIIQISLELDLDVVLFSYSYKMVSETEDIIEKNKDNIDFWIFSGRISYEIACEKVGNSEKNIFVEHTEAGIFKALIEFVHKTGSFLHPLSIDEISTSHLNTALNQLTIKPEKVYVKTFSIKTSTEELIRFHRDLWESGETKGAITCFEEVCLDLKKSGIPVFRISTSDIEIQHTLNILSEKIKTIYFMDSQVAVQVIQIDHLENHFKGTKETYQLQFLELKLKEILINLSEHLNGSLIEKGLGKYLIFSSRGDIERELHNIKEAINNLVLASGLMVGVGIGFGETVFSAELNANNALTQSKEKLGSIIMIQENGEVVEAESESIETSEFPLLKDRVFRSKLKKAKVNMKHYIEVFALLKNSGIKEFTIKEISIRLAKDERNTRRFIESLCEVGLAEYIGLEPNASRGRPRRIYKLTPNNI